MLIQQKAGNINTSPPGGRTIDWLPMEWYETTKRILHKKTKAGKTIALKFLKENPDLKDGDILWQDERNMIAVELMPCDAMVIRPQNNLETAAVCYEIGNNHLQLFYEENEFMLAYDAPLFRVLQAAGYVISRETRKLKNGLKTTVTPHTNSGFNLFNKIIQFTTSSPDV